MFRDADHVRHILHGKHGILKVRFEDDAAMTLKESFGVDKGLETSVRIERVAEKDGILCSTALDPEDLAARFLGVGPKATVASHPTEYLCNEAYWHLLGKYAGNAVLIHIPTIKHFDAEWIWKVKNCL